MISVFTITGCKNSNTSKNINDLISSSDILNWELVYKEISNNKAKAEDYEGKSFIFTGIIQNIEEDYCVLKDMQSDHTLNVYLEKQVLKSLEPKKQIYIIGTLKNTSSIDNPDLVDSVKLNNDDIKKYLILDKSKISSSSYGPNSSFSNYEYFMNNSNIVIKCKESGDYSGTLTKTYDKSMNLQETLLEKILYDDEKVPVKSMTGAGGYFKTQAGLKYMAAAMKTPVSAMETAGEGGPWGMAILASYAAETQKQSLSNYLNAKVFADCKKETSNPEKDICDSFEIFFENYNKGLAVEKAAVENL